HTWVRSWSFDSTIPGCWASVASSENSRWVRSMTVPSRTTLWASMSTARSPTDRTLRPIRPQHRPHAHQQLRHDERLHDVVVAADIEAAEDVFDAGGAGEEEEGHFPGRP